VSVYVVGEGIPDNNSITVTVSWNDGEGARSRTILVHTPTGLGLEASADVVVKLGAGQNITYAVTRFGGTSPSYRVSLRAEAL
jgi:hypothetical protein